MKIWLRAVVVLLVLGGLAAGDFSEAERQSPPGWHRVASADDEEVAAWPSTSSVTSSATAACSR